MLSWQWPYLFYLLPLPFLIRWLSPAADSTSGAILVPFYAKLQQLGENQKSKSISTFFSALIALLTWACLVAAAAHPIWVGDPTALPQDKRDLLLAVDISNSMREDDMLVQNQYVERITAVKAVVGEFVKLRSGDRIGLILFGQQGYLQTPLTFDNKTVNQQLQEAQLGFAGNLTAIGDAIGLAIKVLRGRPAESRVLILLTDGANTAGTEPSAAAKIAAEAKIRIHTVGIGADSKRVRGLFGTTRHTNPSTELDEATLQDIADTTGGQYFRARNPKELQQIYAEIDRLEPMPEEQTFRPKKSLTYWPLSIALILSALLALARILSNLTLRRTNSTKGVER